MRKNVDPYQSLANIGIDFVSDKYADELVTTDCIVLIDDAQNAFTYSNFWGNFLKCLVLPSNLRFVIASTYLIGGTDSPADFATLPRIRPEQMLLDANTSLEYLVNFLQFPFSNYGRLVELIVEDCGGNIGALSIVNHQYKITYHNSLISPTEQTLIDYFISTEFTVTMMRLFGSESVLATSNPDVIDLLYGEMKHIPDLENNNELNNLVKHYIKCGVLSRSDIGEVKFTNAMSRRYFIYKSNCQSR
jgi:hypothetical protein